MAKTDRWNARLQVAANLGLIAGLLLVAVQIQQTRDLTRLQLHLEGTLAFQQVEIAMMGESPAEAWAKSIQDPASHAWFYFGNSFAKKWWTTIKRDGGWDADFVRIVDTELATLDDSQNARWIDEILGAAAAAPVR